MPKRIPQKRYRLAAQSKHLYQEGDIEVDSNAKVSISPDGGAYVQAWTWIDEEEVEDRIAKLPDVSPMKTNRILWRAKRTAMRHNPKPGFEVEFETNTNFTLDGEVPPQLEFLRGKDLRYYRDIYTKAQIEVTFVKFVYAEPVRQLEND